MGSLLDIALYAASQNPDPAARIYSTTAQTVGTANLTTAVYQSIDFDTSGSLIADLTNNRLIATRTGIWTIAANARFASSTTAGPRALILCRSGNTSDRLGNDSSSEADTFGTLLSASAVVRLAAGDYVQALLYQVIGANLATDVAYAGSNCLAMTFNGPA